MFLVTEVTGPLTVLTDYVSCFSWVFPPVRPDKLLFWPISSNLTGVLWMTQGCKLCALVQIGCARHSIYGHFMLGTSSVFAFGLPFGAKAQTSQLCLWNPQYGRQWDATMRVKKKKVSSLSSLMLFNSFLSGIKHIKDIKKQIYVFRSCTVHEYISWSKKIACQVCLLPLPVFTNVYLFVNRTPEKL